MQCIMTRAPPHKMVALGERCKMDCCFALDRTSPDHGTAYEYSEKI
jgi:4-hydroxy-L-threonine phosphate dehydrogenase PdxA